MHTIIGTYCSFKTTVVLAGLEPNQDNRQSSKKNNKYQFKRIMSVCFVATRVIPKSTSDWLVKINALS